MYINQFEITGTPKFYAKGTEGYGEFYSIDGILAYFPYPVQKKTRSAGGTRSAERMQSPEKKEIVFPADASGAFLPITAKGFLHSEEYEETIDCHECERSFGKTLGLSYITVTSFHPYEPSVYLGEEKPPAPCNGTVVGDVQSVKTVEGKERSFCIARLAIKDTTAPIGFSYMAVSSLHPFTVDKGDHLCSRGKLVSTQRCLDLICPACGCVNSFVIDSLMLQAASVQSLNTPRGYFGENDIRC